jgi:hypothetical protein
MMHDAGVLAASMAGLAGPDMGFATAAMAAAAAAAAVAEQQQSIKQQGSTDSSSSSSFQGEASSSAVHVYASLPSGYVTLQAHAVLHCLSDLQRLAVRRQWRGSGDTARFTSIGSNVYGGSYNGYNTTGTPVPTPAPLEPDSTFSAGFSRRGRGSAGPRGSGSGLKEGLGVQGSRGSEGSVGGLGNISRQLVLQCEGKQAWQLVGVLLAAWLHWCGGVDQTAAVDSVGKAMGLAVDEVGALGPARPGGGGGGCTADVVWTRLLLSSVWSWRYGWLRMRLVHGSAQGGGGLGGGLGAAPVGK